MVNQCEAKLLANEMFRRPRWNSRNASQEQFLSWNASFAGRLLGETVEILTMSFNPVSYFAGIGTVLLGSYLAPEPTHHVPCSTVMNRSFG